MISANADTPDVVRRLKAMRADETVRFGGGAVASMWVKRTS